MYYCNNCETFHDNGMLKEIVEGHGESYYMETHFICGHCGSDEYEPADKCPICGNFKKKVDDICQGCENALNEFSTEFVTKMGEYFGQDRKAMIDHILRVLEAMQ